MINFLFISLLIDLIIASFLCRIYSHRHEAQLNSV